MDGYGFCFNFDFLMNEHMKWKVFFFFFFFWGGGGFFFWIWWLYGMSVDAMFFQSNLGVNPYMRLFISSISTSQFL